MAHPSLLFYYFSQRRRSASFRSFFFIPTSLALVTSLFILFYVSSTSNLFTYQHQITLHLKQSPSGSSTISAPTHQFISIPIENASTTPFEALRNDADQRTESQLSSRPQLGSDGMWILSFLLVGISYYSAIFMHRLWLIGTLFVNQWTIKNNFFKLPIFWFELYQWLKKVVLLIVKGWTYWWNIGNGT